MLQAEAQVVLLNYHIGRFVLSSLCVGDYRCGNSTTQSQAPDDGYIYV